MRAHRVCCLLIVALAACGDAEDRGSWTGSVDTLPSGVVRVDNPATAMWAPQEAWRIEESLRLGALDGTGPDVFGSVAYVEVDAGGRLYVFDGHANELRVFDGTGAHIRTIGRAGAGPGEFQGVIGLRFSPDGDLWLIDGPNARYTVVRRDGGLEMLRRPTTVYQVPWLGGFDEAGRFHDQATEIEAGTARDFLIRLDAAGEPDAEFELAMVDLPAPRAGSIRLPLPFSPRQLRAWEPGGAVWQAVSPEYRIVRTELSGDTTLVVSRPGSRISLSLEQRDSVERYVRTVESEFGVSVPRDARPSHAPVLRWFVLDDRRHLWVCATGLDPCDALEVFEPSGRFLGTVALPAAILDSPRPLIRDGRFYAAITGELGQPQLLKGRIIQP